MKSALVFTLVCSFYGSARAEHTLKEIFKWKTIDYEFANAEARASAIRNGEYIPQNNVPFGLEVWRDKVFVTVPRRNPGIPSTLNYVPLNSKRSSPLLIPYPDWSSNNVSSSSAALVSTFRVNVDRCDRLWTVDTGSVVDFEGVGERLAAPRIRLFDLRAEGALLAEYALKGREYACDSSYTSIVADVAADSCGQAFAYAVDPSAPALLVYSLRANEAWRLRHPYFLPDPLRSDYAIGELRFQWYDGIFGVALAEADESGFRRLFAHPMSGLVELAADTRQLRNRSTWTDGRAAFAAFRLLGSRQPSFQAASSAYDPGSGVLFYSLVAKNAVGCWNSRRFPRYSGTVNDVVASDDRTMIYFSDLKVDPASNLWAISNRLPVILYGTFDQHDYNFRIFSARARHLITNTLCDGEQSSQFWSTKI